MSRRLTSMVSLLLAFSYLRLYLYDIPSSQNVSFLPPVKRDAPPINKQHGRANETDVWEQQPTAKADYFPLRRHNDNHEAPPKVHFRTYGNHRFAKSKKRIVQEANSTGWFSTVGAMGPEDLTKDFAEKYRDILSLERGGGYWIWRFDLFGQIVTTIKEGDFLVFLDAGCHLNKAGERRFWEYIDTLKTSSYDMLAFRIGFLEANYTTPHIFKAFGVLGVEKETHQDSIVEVLSYFEKARIFSSFP